uniref:Uncharacterized protein n=1 Tax=Oryza meridionalis TaxID=40149 RepID=A0A0E0E4E4_9ORYZ
MEQAMVQKKTKHLTTSDNIIPPADSLRPLSTMPDLALNSSTKYLPLLLPPPPPGLATAKKHQCVDFASLCSPRQHQPTIRC